MSELTDGDRIWNRALSPGSASDPALMPGDRALAGLLRAHGLAMNGGVWHSVDSLSDDEWESAVVGFRYFGLTSIAELLADAKRRVAEVEEAPLEEQEALEEELDTAYSALVPTDQSLADVFEERLRSEPSAFAAI